MTSHSLSAEEDDRTAAAGRVAPFHISYRTAAFSFALVETGLITLVGATAPGLYAWAVGVPVGPSDLAFRTALLAAGLNAAAMRSAGLYRLPALLDPVAVLRRYIGVCCLVLLTITGLLFFLKAGAALSRGTFVTFATMVAVIGGAVRLGAAEVASALVRRDALVGRPVFALGEPGELRALDSADLLKHYGLQIVGRAVFRTEPDGALAAAPSLSDIPRLARESGARAFLLAAAAPDGATMQAIEDGLRRSPLPAFLLPNQVIRAAIDRSGPTEDRARHLVLLQRAPMGWSGHVLKRLADVALAVTGLLLLCPLLVGIALAIRLESRGPILFRQRRSGFDQRHFEIVKFRTMRICREEGAITQARRRDDRVTRVGAVLRRSSMDELPQLWNVLRGDMSLVGPRPHAISHDDEYRAIIGDYLLRHHVRPGMTGWAQVNGLRGETARPDAMARRVAFDLWYIRNWSPLLDLCILGRTVSEVLRLEAY